MPRDKTDLTAILADRRETPQLLAGAELEQGLGRSQSVVVMVRMVRLSSNIVARVRGCVGSQLAMSRMAPTETIA